MPELPSYDPDESEHCFVTVNNAWSFQVSLKAAGLPEWLAYRRFKQIRRWLTRLCFPDEL